MKNLLGMPTLWLMGARIAILSVGKYALPVRCRFREPALECRVPTWAGVSDLLEEMAEVTLVVMEDGEPDRWLFIRGAATVVTDPDWEGLRPPHWSRVEPADLYQLLRIEPKRIEMIDEQRGWGFRETVDL